MNNKPTQPSGTTEIRTGNSNRSGASSLPVRPPKKPSK